MSLCQNMEHQSGNIFFYIFWRIHPLVSGLALHPLDGIAQGGPHEIAIFLVPTHFTTHLTVVFLGAIWSANIHDCIDEKMWPLMGGGYHVIHHLSNRHNYGLYTIWMDWMFGTLSHPVSNPTKPNWGTCPSCFSNLYCPSSPPDCENFIVSPLKCYLDTHWLLLKNCMVVQKFQLDATQTCSNWNFNQY